MFVVLLSSVIYQNVLLAPRVCAGKSTRMHLLNSKSLNLSRFSAHFTRYSTSKCFFTVFAWRWSEHEEVGSCESTINVMFLFHNRKLHHHQHVLKMNKVLTHKMGEISVGREGTWKEKLRILRMGIVLEIFDNAARFRNLISD
jgi:hypothetical protein